NEPNRKNVAGPLATQIRILHSRFFATRRGLVHFFFLTLVFYTNVHTHIFNWCNPVELCLIAAVHETSVLRTASFVGLFLFVEIHHSQAAKTIIAYLQKFDALLGSRTPMWYCS
ncbi:hypothetical protein F5Y06DRAFT_270588, partial [Hypoxylon sp. FL0890]